MRRRARSTTSPRRMSSGASPSSRRRVSSSRTGSTPCATPIASWCWSAGGSSRKGRSRRSLARAGRLRPCSRGRYEALVFLLLVGLRELRAREVRLVALRRHGDRLHLDDLLLRLLALRRHHDRAHLADFLPAGDLLQILL